MSRLSIRLIETLEPRARDYIVFDEDTPGFGLRIMTSGKKSYLIQYRAGGRTRRVTFCRYGVLTVEEARKRARELLGNVAKGDNPAEVRSDARRAPTVNSVCNRFYEEHVLQRCKPSTQREYQRAIDIFIKPELGTFKIADVTRADVAAIQHKYRHIPYQANRTLGVLSKMFNLCEIWGLRPDGSNPCRHVAKYRENKRERFLSKEEIERLARVLDDADANLTESWFMTAAIRLLLLTGCRHSEIQKLKWAYVREDHIGLPDSKTGARRIPLPPAAKAVLDAVPLVPGNEYVFAGLVENQHITDFQRPWRRIRKKAGLPKVRIHDLRHTYASNAVMSGLNIVMVGKLLGHTQIQTTMRYAHLADSAVKDAARDVSNALSEAMMPATKPTPPPPKTHLRLVQ